MQQQYKRTSADEPESVESAIPDSAIKPIVIPASRIEVDETSKVPNTPADISDKYTFVRQLGKGSQGSVYEAFRNSDHQRVAIKVLNINSIQNWKEYDLFWREAETLKVLNISGVATFYEAIESLDTPAPHAYLVQQCIQGRSLSDMIHSGYRFNVQTVFKLALQLIDILEQLQRHDPPVIHRDIKPSNIILEPDGSSYKVYLTDFGAVCNPLLQKGSTVAGTYGYMPPEQLMGRPSSASDIYALGATIAGVLSGMEPSEMMVTDFRLSIEKPLENMPYPIVSCLRRMTMPDIAERLCDLDQIRKLFNDFSQGRYEYQEIEEHNLLSAFRQHRQLKKVERLGQKGNYDLWLHLPEKTPRKRPWSYRMINLMPITIYNLVTCDGALTRLHPGYFIRHPIWWLESVLFWYGFVAALFIVLYLLIEFPIIVIIRFILLLIHPFRCLFTSNAPPLQAYFLTPPFERLNPSAHKSIRTLLIHGRKTMATITDIQYVQTTEIAGNKFITRADEFNMDSNLSDNYYNSIDNFSYHPSFRVQYSFNPPDDAIKVDGQLRNNEDDLIHSVTVSADPATTLKPGDILPILYYFDPDNPNHVLSMPYPYPLNTIKDLDHVYCETEM